MNLPLKKSTGFTLLELMITVAIIATLSGAIIPSFTNYLKNQTIKQAQSQVKSDMRSVQNRAMTGSLFDTKINNDANRPIAYWGILTTVGAGSYSVLISDKNTTCPSDVAHMEPNQFQGTYNLPSGITLSSATHCVYFDMNSGNISEVGSTPGYVEISNGSTTSRVTYNSYGLIGN